MVEISLFSVPRVTIYVRHNKNCPHREDEFWRKCKCRKWVRWFDGKLYRKPARTNSWTGAESTQREIERQYERQYDRLKPDAPSPVVFDSPQKTLNDAVLSFIDSKRSQGISAGVIGKYERELGRLVTFAGAKGKLFPKDISLDDLIAFRGGWSALYSSPTTRQKVQERLRGFLKYCYEAGHIDRIPRLSPIKAKDSPTLPLSRQEYGRLLRAVRLTGFDATKTRRVLTLIQFMRHSGLAIRDAVTLRRDEIHFDGGKGVYRVVITRQKTGTHVSVPIPEFVAKQLQATPNGNPKYVFWNTGSAKEESAVTNWQHDLREVFRKAGFTHGHPHQLRDTFAVDMLAQGVPLEDVSRLLGHESIKTTERYYAKWVPARQDRLDLLVVDAWKKAGIIATRKKPARATT